MLARPAVVVCALAALSLSACGSTSKPLAGTPGVRTLAGGLAPGRGVVDDPRHKTLPCLTKLDLGVTEQGSLTLLVGRGTGQARIVFRPTPGSAQADQIDGQVQGAEVIGSALLFPESMSDAHLKKVENCLAQGVQG